MSERRYLDLLSISEPQEALAKIKDLASNLSDNDHLIRSCIFDMHAAVELELRRIFYHHFRALLGFTDDDERNAKIERNFEKAIDRLSFLDMHRILKPILTSWPYEIFDAIEDINTTRNQAAHRKSVAEISYQGRNPFLDPDCFAQMFFDTWAIRHDIAKFFERTIEMPKWELKEYRKKYGYL